MHLSRLRFRHPGVVLILAILVGAGSVLSEVRMLPDATGTWKPWKPFAAIASARQAQAATSALVQQFESELLAFQSILRRASAVASPVGFSVETWGHLAASARVENAPDQPSANSLPLAGALTFGAFPIFEYERNGKMIREDTGETALQMFLVNQIGPGVIDSGNVPDWGAVERDAFLQPLPGDEIAGLPRYGDGLVIARDPADLWTSLSHRGALEIVVKAREADLRGMERSAESLSAQLAKVRDPAARAKRMKEVQQAAATMPDPQAFIRLIEESIRAEEAALMKDLAPTGGVGRGLIEARKALAEVTGRLAELSPAELGAPVCYAAKGATLAARFSTTPAAGCHPLVRPNYDYFDKTVPRSAPQVVIITPIARCFDMANRHNSDLTSVGCLANRGLIETLDKEAIRARLR